MGAEVLELPRVESGRFVLNMPEEEYHAHPALSQSGMKNLLRSPKHYRAQRAMNRPRPEFDVGHAAHGMVLGVGLPIVEIPGRLLSADGGIRSNAAKAFVEEARAKGEVPLKPVVYRQVRLMVDSVLGNEKARRLLERQAYTEASLFATDPGTGVALRGRLDRLTDDGIPVDLKTTTDVRVRKLTNAIVDFGYDIQAATYDYLLRLVLGIDPAPMHFIFVEKDFPHDVRVIRLADPLWMETGAAKMRAAIDLFAWCVEQDRWPGDDEDGGEILDLPAPRWYGAELVEVDA